MASLFFPDEPFFCFDICKNCCYFKHLIFLKVCLEGDYIRGVAWCAGYEAQILYVSAASADLYNLFVIVNCRRKKWRLPDVCEDSEQDTK